MKVTPYLFLCCFGLCLFVFSSSSAVGQGGPVVESVSFHREDAGKERVRIKLNGPYTSKIYTMEGDNKPRLVIDFALAGYSGLITPVVKGGDTLVRNIRIGVHSEPSPKVRVVLDLQPGRKYTYTKDFVKQENVLNINFVPAGQAQTPQPAVALIAAEGAKKEMISGPKKIIVAAVPKEQPAVAAKSAGKATPAEKRVANMPETLAKPSVKAVDVPGKKPVDAASLARDMNKDTAKVMPTAPPVQHETAKPEAKPDEKTAAKPETKTQAEPAMISEQQTVVKSPTKPLLEPTGKPVQEEDQKKATALDSVVAEIQKAPELQTPQGKAPEQIEAPATPTPVLLEVTYENNSSKGEMIFFHLNGFYPPSVSAVEGDTPQVVCDFVNMAKDAKVKPVIETRGAYVQKIETKAGTDPKKIQVVLVLTPHRDYDLRQVFFKEDNLFVLVVNTLAEDKAGKATDQKK